MCGIICEICSENNNHDQIHFLESGIKNRGPDYYGIEKFKMNEMWYGFFSASVLHTQGKEYTRQPIRTSENDILLWNGDIFDGILISEAGCDHESRNLSDTEIIFKWLQENDHCILELPTLIEGPYSFVYYNSKRNELYFGRDTLGRHSLLWNVSVHSVLITSVGHKGVQNLVEVPAIGIFCFNLNHNKLVELHLHQWTHVPEFLTFDSNLVESLTVHVYKNAINALNFNVNISCSQESDESMFATNLTNSGDMLETMEHLLANEDVKNHIEVILEHLNNSCRKRVTIRRNICKNCDSEDSCSTDHVKLGILFSGGLDSTIIAYLADKYVPIDEPIDLLNVAFDQKGSFDVPDRKTGLLSLEELRNLCPNRKWNFVQINVTNEELEHMRNTRVCHLIYPLQTVLDDSLGCALWFACRGHGDVDGHSYTSSAKIILLGNGADEQLGGYTRHRNILKRDGWKNLGEQLLKETLEISRRNLGRDDRIACDSGRQPRFPFLDEKFVEYVSYLPPWEKCDPISFPRGLGDKLILRLTALKLGLRRCAVFPKRAFQFGCRIAKSNQKGDEKSIHL